MNICGTLVFSSSLVASLPPSISVLSPTFPPLSTSLSLCLFLSSLQLFRVHVRYVKDKDIAHRLHTMRQRQAESLWNKKMQRGSADVIDDRMSSFRNRGEMHTITHLHTKNTLLHCATCCRYELQKKCNCIVKKFESSLILQKSKMQPFAHVCLCWLKLKESTEFFYSSFLFFFKHNDGTYAWENIRSHGYYKSQGPVAVKCVNHQQRAGVLHLHPCRNGSAVHSRHSSSDTKLSQMDREKRERTGWWERERERESIPLSFSQEVKKEALTLNEQKEAGYIAPVQFTLTPKHLQWKNPHGTSGCKKIAVHTDEMISSICLHNPHTHRGKIHPEYSFNHRALKAEVLSVMKHLNLRDFPVAKK